MADCDLCSVSIPTVVPVRVFVPGLRTRIRKVSGKGCVNHVLRQQKRLLIDLPHPVHAALLENVTCAELLPSCSRYRFPDLLSQKDRKRILLCSAKSALLLCRKQTRTGKRKRNKNIMTTTKTGQ
jgi:hypothetical protein